MTEREYRKAEGVSRSELFTLTESPEKFKWAKEHPEEIARLIAELAEVKAAAANKDQRYNNLVAAIKEYFSRNIPVNSVMRKPEELGALNDFPELADGIRLTLIPEPRTNTQERGRYYGR